MSGPGNSDTTITLGDSVRDVDVAGALISPLSQTRAGKIYSRQDRPFSLDMTSSWRDLQLQNPPEIYVIRYHVDAGANANMVRGLRETIATMQAQMPGRFQFLAVDDPAAADIPVRPITHTKNGGETDISSGRVGLHTASFTGEYNDYMHYAVQQEILHALGLEHPQDIVPGKPDTQMASFYDSNVTSDTSNRISAFPMRGYPTSLMPSDIDALQRLYPIAADRRNKATVVGYAADVGVPQDFRLSWTTDAGTWPIGLPASGTVYQPMTDRDHDILTIAGNSSLNRVTVDGHGLVVRHGDNAATYLQVRPEEIRLSPDADTLDLTGPATIRGTTNNPGAEDAISLKGKGAKLVLSAQDMVTAPQPRAATHLRIGPGASVSIELRDMAQFDRHLFAGMFRFENGNRRGWHGSWMKDERGIYDVFLTPPGGGAPTHLAFTLPDADDQSRAKFEAALATDAFSMQIPLPPREGENSGATRAEPIPMHRVIGPHPEPAAAATPGGRKPAVPGR